MRGRDLCLWLGLLAQASSGSAQAFSGSVEPSSASTQTDVASASGFNFEKGRVQLAALDGLWRFRIGDDPAWAEAGLDDAQWPPAAPGAPWPIPQRAPSTITGWYRLHIILPDSHGPFSLLLPPLPTSYQVFANGREIGHFGSPAELVKSPGPRLFKIPSDVIRPRNLVLCVRVQYQPHLAFYAGPSGFHGTPILGSASQATARLQLERVGILHGAVAAFFVAFLCFQVAVVSWFFYLLRRSDREYMWLAMYAFANALNFALIASLPLIQWPLVPAGLFFGVLGFVFEVSEIQIVANLLTSPSHSRAAPDTRKRRNYPLMLTVVAALLIVGVNVMLLVDGDHSDFWNNIQSIPFLAILISFVWLIRSSASKDRRRAWIIFAALTCVFSYFIIFNLRTLPFVSQTVRDLLNGSLRSLILSPFPIGCWELIGVVIVTALFAVIVERFITARRDEERMKSEIEAARLVQQVLVPAETPMIPGFHIETFYKPAGEVGGDFFQIVSILDGGALIVIGDVSGKGMPAAMTVSLLVGTFRTLAHYSQSPGEILTAMNRRMLARSHGGFTTCLVLRADTGGKLIAASAGHLAPYCNGEELNIDGGLPLGLDANASYAESTFELPTAAQLTLVTDGVVEARAKDGQLFGFERSRAISNQPAAKIAEAAQSFGQDDDITVVTLSRVATAVSI